MNERRQPTRQDLERAARIRRVRATARETQEQFARALGVERGAVTNWERGGGIAREKLETICSIYPWVRLDWLASGKGDGPPKPTAEPEFDPDHPQGSLTGGKASIPELNVRAGMGGGGFESLEVRQDGDYADPLKPERWHFPGTFLRNDLQAAAERIIIIETQGDSMLPTIAPGERVIVDTGHRVPSPDGIYALRDRFGAVVVKRLQVMRRGDPPIVKIISDNKAHAEEEVAADEIEMAIVGRVICGLKRY